MEGHRESNLSLVNLSHQAIEEAKTLEIKKIFACMTGTNLFRFLVGVDIRANAKLDIGGSDEGQVTSPRG